MLFSYRPIVRVLNEVCMDREEHGESTETDLRSGLLLFFIFGGSDSRS